MRRTRIVVDERIAKYLPRLGLLGPELVVRDLRSADLSGDRAVSAVLVGADSAQANILLVQRVRTACPAATIIMAFVGGTFLSAAALRSLARDGLDDCVDVLRQPDVLRVLGSIQATAPMCGTGLIRELVPHGDHRSGLIAEVVRYCGRNVHRRLTASGVAQWFGLHRRSLDRWMLTVTGRTTAEWIREARLATVRRLRADGFSFQDIADTLGYETPAGVQMLLRRHQRTLEHDAADGCW